MSSTARRLMRSTASNVAGQAVVMLTWFALTPSSSTSSVPRTLVAYGKPPRRRRRRVTRYVAELRARRRSDEASASRRRYGCQRQPCCPNLSRSTSDTGPFQAASIRSEGCQIGSELPTRGVVRRNVKVPARIDASEATRDGGLAMRGSGDGIFHAPWESLDVC
jgi:hypothetical protein